MKRRAVSLRQLSFIVSFGMRLTNEVQQARRMCFQIRRDTGQWYSAEYSSFSLGPEADKYFLNVTGYSGDAGDANASPVHQLRISNGMQFSTPDRDNDNNVGQCAAGKSGWWCNNCARSALTTNYKSTWNAVTDVNNMNVEFARMMVKLD